MSRKTYPPQRPAPQDYHEWNACGRKLSYRTRHEAKVAISRNQNKQGYRYKVYKCPYCREYHTARCREEGNGSQ